MPDSVASRSNAAAKNSAAGPPRKGPGSQPPDSAAGRPLRSPAGQPLKTKAEKRAEAKATKARERARQRRRQALTVGGAAAVVLALIVGLALWIGNTAGQQPNPPAASAEAAPTPAEPSAAAFPPVPPGADAALNTKPTARAGSGSVTDLKVTTLIEGAGAEVRSGQTVAVNYVGVTYADGKEFDSSWSRSEAFSFPIGAGNVIPGWDQGLLGVQVGSRVQLDIPADLAYGDNPSGGQPAGALRFIVDVLSAT